MGTKETPREPEFSSDERLESWKRIGAYLNRDARTLRRWEKDEGLPVHRHLHLRQSSVYAYKSELDAWWESRPGLTHEAEKATHRGRRRAILVLAALAVVVVVTVVIMRSFGPPALPFAKRDWVLVADIDNRTGEPILDGTLEYALELELSNSRFVNVVPRERLEDTLDLMQKPRDVRIDRDLGREIALRDGGIHALVTGRADKLGGAYVLSVTLVNPTDGVTVASFSEEATGNNQLLPAVRRLANDVRVKLGEETPPINRADTSLARVTTPSFRALHLFSQADAVIARSQAGDITAEHLLKEAIALDPEFASAYMHLAFALRNQGRPSTEYVPYAERAMALSENLTDRERFFITGAYHSMVEEHDQAIATYRTLVELYPDHYWGNNNLVGWLRTLGRNDEAVPYQVKMAELQPQGFDANVSAGRALLLSANDPTAAKPYLTRARQLIRPQIIERAAWRVAWLELYPMCESWHAGLVTEALAEVERAAARVENLTEGARSDYAWQIGGAYLTLGKLQLAGEWFRSNSNPRRRARGQGMVGWARGNRIALAESLRDPPDSFVTAMLLADAGYPGLAEDAMYLPQPAIGNEVPANMQAVQQAALGQLALARGQTNAAIDYLEPSIPVLGQDIRAAFFLAADALARAYEANDDPDAAMQVLLKASRQRSRIIEPLSGAFWLRLQSHRMELLQRLGAQGEAQPIAAELLALLAHADPDHAILRKLSD
jgi:tetratricopeptide (TPR) repeat protein